MRVLIVIITPENPKTKIKVAEFNFFDSANLCQILCSNLSHSERYFRSTIYHSSFFVDLRFHPLLC